MNAATPDEPAEFAVSAEVSIERWTSGALSHETDQVAEEMPVALVHHGVPHVVMLATPADLEDFAIGFSLNDGIITSPGDVDELSIVEVTQGVELRMMLKRHNRDALVTRRRHRAGPVGCGLCGIDSIDAARIAMIQTIIPRDRKAAIVLAAVKGDALSRWPDGRPRIKSGAGS